MSEYLTTKEMEWISSRINSQEGQNHPCSNQVVVCGFFGSYEEWKEFCNNNANKIKYAAREIMVFEDGERWHWFSINTYNCRGYRFYKIKVSRKIDRDVFLNNIYPYCSHYCKEIEWM